MLVELMKLSKELYELEMISESLQIDEMVHKLYGVSTPTHFKVDGENEDSQYEESGIDLVRSEIQKNASSNFFREELIRAIGEAFDQEDLEEIRNTITDYIE